MCGRRRDHSARFGRHLDPLPPLAGTARPGLRHAEEPRADGLHAHGPRGGARRLRADGRVLRGARARRSGPHRDGRRRAEPLRPPRTAGVAALVPVAGRKASTGHRRRARGGRQDRDADPARRALRVSPAVGRAVRDPLADHAVQAAGSVRVGRAPDDRRVCPLRGARAARRLRRRRGDGLGRLPARPVHRAAHQSSQRRVGRSLRESHPLPVEIVRRIRAAVGPDFIIVYRLSMLDLVEGGRRGTRSWRWRRPSRPPAPPSSTPASAGTRRACRRSRRWCPTPRSRGRRSDSRPR